MVVAYLLSAMGIPIYLHYCGGELEKVNYVIKSNSCCGGDEDDTNATSDCCKDENVFIKNATDFTFRHSAHQELVKACSQLFYISLPFGATLQSDLMPLRISFQEAPPPKLQHSLMISTAVLRI